MKKTINLLPDPAAHPPATQVTPEQIEKADGEEKQKLVEKQNEQLRQIHLQNFMKRMMR